MCGSFFSGQKDEEQFNELSKKAKQYAIKHEKNIYLYKKDGVWAFIEEEEARDQGIYPTGGIVSHLQPVSA